MAIFNEYGNTNNLPENHPINVTEKEIWDSVNALFLNLIVSKEANTTEIRALAWNLEQTIALCASENILRAAMAKRRKEKSSVIH